MKLFGSGFKKKNVVHAVEHIEAYLEHNST